MVLFTRCADQLLVGEGFELIHRCTERLKALLVVQLLVIRPSKPNPCFVRAEATAKFWCQGEPARGSTAQDLAVLDITSTLLEHLLNPIYIQKASSLPVSLLLLFYPCAARPPGQDTRRSTWQRTGATA